MLLYYLAQKQKAKQKQNSSLVVPFYFTYVIFNKGIMHLIFIFILKVSLVLLAKIK